MPRQNQCVDLRHMAGRPVTRAAGAHTAAAPVTVCGMIRASPLRASPRPSARPALTSSATSRHHHRAAASASSTVAPCVPRQLRSRRRPAPAAVTTSALSIRRRPVATRRPIRASCVRRDRCASRGRCAGAMRRATTASCTGRRRSRARRSASAAGKQTRCCDRSEPPSRASASAGRARTVRSTVCACRILPARVSTVRSSPGAANATGTRRSHAGRVPGRHRHKRWW